MHTVENSRLGEGNKVKAPSPLTIILGGNGAGKSAVFDAVLFVLGQVNNSRGEFFEISRVPKLNIKRLKLQHVDFLPSFIHVPAAVLVAGVKNEGPTLIGPLGLPD